MIELRYLDRRIDDPTGTGLLQECYVRILQWRKQINILELGIQEPIWSEWEDVPIVKEQQT